jgi:hypothetical protein
MSEENGVQEMDRSKQYYAILEQMDELSDEELVALSGYVKEMIAAREHMARYDPAKDPTVTGKGLFEGPPDLSERVALARYVEIMNSDTLPDDYDEDNDPSVGFLSGPTDLASRAKEILRAEFG